MKETVTAAGAEIDQTNTSHERRRHRTACTIPPVGIDALRDVPQEILHCVRQSARPSAHVASAEVVDLLYPPLKAATMITSSSARRRWSRRVTPSPFTKKRICGRMRSDWSMIRWRIPGKRDSRHSGSCASDSPATTGSSKTLIIHHLLILRRQIYQTVRFDALVILD